MEDNTQLEECFEINLIELVKQKPELYDKNNKNYSDTQHKNICWDTIAKMLKRSSGDCKTRWKDLKETFMGNFQARPSGSSAEENIWPHLERMMFMKEFIKPRKPIKRKRSIGSTLSAMEGAALALKRKVEEPVENNSDTLIGKTLVALLNEIPLANKRDRARAELFQFVFALKAKYTTNITD